MPTHSFIQCDVFTDRVFEGNPLAVFPDATGIDEQDMQKIAREMNLSETVFVLPPTDPTRALRRLRIFTTSTELPMAGHPVVGTWNVLARLGVVAPPESGSGPVTISQELQIGILPVTIHFQDGAPRSVVMTQPSPRVGQPLDLEDECAQALGLAPADIGFEKLPVIVASTGVPFLIVPIANRAALSRIAVNSPALAGLLDRAGARAVYAVTREPHSSEAAVSSRMLSGGYLGIAEDPATGSAAGPLAAALVHYGIIPAPNGQARFIIEQGVDMGRPSRIEAEVDTASGEVQTVRIAGASVEVLRGELSL